MAWNKPNKAPLTVEIDKSFDFIIEEGANTSINLRRISWGGKPAKLDIRKWAYQDGKEIAMKGVGLTEDGGNELANVLVEHGYGNTKRLMKAIKERKDYNTSDDESNNIDDSDEEYYDASELFGDD